MSGEAPMAEDIVHDRLRAAADVLGAVPARSSKAVSGSRAGIQMRYEITDLRRSKVTAQLPGPVADVVLRVVPTSEVSSDLERGLTIDVITGHAVLDRLFHVEGAPSDVVRAVLDTDVTQWLEAHPAATLELVETGSALELTCPDLPPDDIAPMLEMLVRLASSLVERVHRVTLGRELAVTAPSAGDRRVPDTAMIETRQQLAHAEVRRLRIVKSARDPFFWTMLGLSASAMFAMCLWLVPQLPALVGVLIVLLALPGTLAMMLVISVIGLLVGLDRPFIRLFLARHADDIDAPARLAAPPDGPRDESAP